MDACQTLGTANQSEYIGTGAVAQHTVLHDFLICSSSIGNVDEDSVAKNMTEKPKPRKKNQNRRKETKTKNAKNDRQPDSVRLPVELKSLGFTRLYSQTSPPAEADLIASASPLSRVISSPA